MVATADTPSWVALAVAVLALAGTVYTAWHTTRRAGTRTQYANETARNAEFQMVKREVYGAFLAATRTYLAHPDATREAEYRKEYGRVLLHASPRLHGEIAGIVGTGLPVEGHWEQLVTVLRTDVE